ncbi:hypothetical protein ATCC90586_000905 [Pythium insidiosum]|nr:hypothetical protein ATCC90586_000905 [Pythium insidiosum]
MDIHEEARTLEAEGRLEDCIDRFLTAGDWYMKAYSALTAPADQSARQAVREQIEFVIEHVSQLKAKKAAPTADPTPDAAVVWPSPPLDPLSAPPDDPPPPPPLGDPSRIPSDSPAELLHPSTLVSDDELARFAWPEAPVNRRRSSARAPGSRTSSGNRLLDPPAAPVHSVAPPPAVQDVHKQKTEDDEEEDSSSYSAEELDVLRRSSRINGHVFVPWLDDLDAANENFSAPLFEDPDGLVPLSRKQLRHNAQWLRPSEFAALCGQPPVMIDVIGPQSVKQDVVTDCSFVASLCIAAAYEQRFHKRLITNIVFPVDPTTQQPVYNPAGKYVVKLWANGVPRKVVIDDRLPVNSETRELLCSCTTRPNELWVSLIEKAYLKLCGGYDYPGGNSGIDLFALTGWIPERLSIAEYLTDQHEERIWEQLKSAFHFGDCIITMTTGDLDKDAARAIGLVPLHVYAVLNVFETTTLEGKTLRLLHVKNPWRKFGWKGPFSKWDTATWQSAVGDELREYQRQFYRGTASSAADDDNADDGLFWIDLESVKQHVESLYLNWNPELFPYKYVIHEHWPLERGPANDSITLAYNPQYSLRFRRRSAYGTLSAERSSSTVWVLLTRHVQRVEREDDTAAQQYLTLLVFRHTGGKRVFYSQHAMYRGTYSNNPHTLVSLDVDFSVDPEPTFTLVASQYEKFAPLDYTLSVFSTSPFVCRPVPHIESAANAVTIQGEWDALSAGGRPFVSTFMNNPQYHVRLVAPANHIYIFLETTFHAENYAVDEDVPVNLRAVLNATERVCGLPAATSSSDSEPRTTQVLSSGEYRVGLCLIELDPATAASISDLVLIPSTFEPHVPGQFRIRILSDPPTAFVMPTSLPHEEEGKTTVTMLGRWDLQLGTAAGCASYGCYTFNPSFLVRVTEECSLFARLLPLRDSPDAPTSSLPSINVSIFASNEDGSLLLSTTPKTAFRGATSDDGVYHGGNPCGVATPRNIAFPVGWYVIVASTYEPEDGGFELRVVSSRPVHVRRLETAAPSSSTVV